MAELSKKAEESTKELASNKKASDIITAEAVAAALKADKGAQAKLKSFEVADFTAKGDNYVTFVTSVEVEYCVGDEVRNVSYVVKCNPQNSMESMSEGIAFTFRKETIFYDQVLPELNAILKSLDLPNLSVPQFYYASAVSNRDLMFLEDMRKKHFKMFDRRKGLDKDHAMLVLKEMARLHAAGKILLEKGDKKQLLKKYAFDEDIYEKFPQLDVMYTEWFKSIFMNISSTLAEVEGYKKAAKSLEVLAPQGYSLLAQGAKPVEPFSSVCHGDCWTNNFLFRYEDAKPVEVCLVDFQMHRYSSVATDLQYFFYTSFNGDLRKSEFENFFTFYYTELEKCVKLSGLRMNFSKDELHGEYEAKGMFGLTVALIAIPIIMTEPSDAMSLDGFTEEEKDKFVAEQDKYVKNAMKNNPLLRPRVLDMIDEKIKHGVLN